MFRKMVTALSLLLPHGVLLADDVPWHIDGARARALVRVIASADGPGTACCVRIVPGTAAPAGQHLRAWSIRSGREVPVQRLADGSVLLAPGQFLPPAEEERFLLYAGDTPSELAAGASFMAAECAVDTPRYRATIDSARGGIISSLLLKSPAGDVELLGKGVRWWHRREPMVTTESFGRVTVEPVAAGLVATVLRVRYADFPEAGCMMTTTTTFFSDYIDVDYDVRIPRPATIDWLKLPVNLRGMGSTPGLYSNSTMKDMPLDVAGEHNRWTPDRLWHDVSYTGEDPAGLGVIARDVRGELFFMDSVRPDENEWVYAEPFGWKHPVQVEQDFTTRIRLVPHAPGRGQWRETVIRLPGAAAAALSPWQAFGGPPIDSDSDGLTDLAELELTTNPTSADTDMDGSPDGEDREPLRGSPPRRSAYVPGFKAERTPQADTVARVAPVKGVPTLVIDGKPYGPMCLTRCAASYEQLREFGDRNFQVHFELVGAVGWPGEQLNTFRRLDRRISRFLDEIPNARIILRLYLCNPPRFAADYPDETLRFNDGRVDHFDKWYAMRDRPEEERGYPSFASELWRRQTAEALFRYVTHIRRSSYSRNVIGYFICGGGTEEWYYWSDYDHTKLAVDYSAPMQRAFRQYLRRKYAGDVRKLREAWNDPSADFATALPPGPQLRRRTDWGLFYDPSTQQPVRDYYTVHNKAMEDSLLIFARTVKQACQGRQLVGMFHGYLQNHWLLEGGQATLKELLASPDVDFWSGPPQYNRRGHGEHACNRFPGASLRAHGKLWISESDIRTCYSSVSAQNPALYGRVPDLAASLGTLTREFAHQLCEGANGWWFPMGADWYNREPVMTRFGAFQRIGEASVHCDRRTETEVATVVDLDSLLTAPPWPVTTSLLDAMKVQELCRLGTPVDHYLLDDILARSAKHYKLVIMLNAFALDNRERKLVDKRLRQRGTTLVWMFAPGLFNPDQAPELDLAQAGTLLGYPLAEEKSAELRYDMRLTAAGSADFPGFSDTRVFGNFERPEWVGDDSGTTVRRTPKPTTYRQRFSARVGPGSGLDILARFEDGGLPSIVRRRLKGVTEYWIGSVMAPADLLRAIARQAGCHLYCDADEIIYANRSFLAIHAAQEGEKELKLRRRCTVIEPLTGSVIAADTDTFSITVNAFETRLFFTGREDEWREATDAAAAFHARLQADLQHLRTERAATERVSAVPPASAADPAATFALTELGLVTSFLVCGPFPNPDPSDASCGFDRDFLAGEAEVKPQVGASYETRFEATAGSPESTAWFGGKTGNTPMQPAWRPIATSMDTPRLAEQLPETAFTERIAYYVACYVVLDRAQVVRVGVGSDDGFKLWVNGTLLGGLNCSRGVGIDIDRYPVDMRQGGNLVLLKILQGGGPTGWSLRLATPAGKALTGARIRLAP